MNKSKRVWFGAGVLVVWLSAEAFCGETSVTIPIPREVGQALQEAGVRIEPGGWWAQGTTMAAIIGGGVVVAALIIAWAIRRKKK